MYLLVQNFENGMDSRRMAITSRPGTLQEIINAHITRGGEIEKRKAFIPISTLPTGQTFGLHSANGQLWTFGSTASPTIVQPVTPAVPDALNDILPRISYMRLTPPATTTTFILPENLNTRAVTTAAQKNLTCTKVAHGLTAGSVYTITIGAVTAERMVMSVTSADVFVLSTDETGTTTIPSGVCASAVSSTGTGITVTVAADYTVSDAGFGAGSNPKIYFPELHSLDNNYKIHTYVGDLTYRFDISTYTGTLTKILFPAITVLKRGVSDPWSGAGGTNLIASEVPWIFDATYTLAGSRDLTAKALATKINESTGTHGNTASANGGVIYITGTGTAGDDVFLTVRCGVVLSDSGVVDRGVVAELKAGAVNMTDLIASENYDGKIYAVAEFDGSTILHFYNGKVVTDWGTIALSGDNAGVALYFASQIALEGSYSAISSGSDIYINFSEVDVDWSVSASTVNGGSVTDQTLTISTTAATSTTAQVTKVTVGGTYESGDFLTITIAGVNYTIQAGASVIGRFVRTFSNKMYSTAGSLLYFSEVDTIGGAAAFSLDTLKGSGVINLSNHDSGSEAVNAISVYQGNLAIFGENTVQIWVMNADPRLNARSQMLTNIGTYSPRSVVSLGNIDTFFLSASGIRSLRARDNTDAAVVADVGTPLDEVILTDMRSLSDVTREAAVGVIEPQEGRYWLCMGNRAYIYSYFPNSGISAWSVYEPTYNGAPLAIEYITSLNQRLYCRVGELIYAYGGINGGTYDASTVTVTFPFMDAGKPAHMKTLMAIDTACEGTWNVAVGMEPTTPNDRANVGIITNSTYCTGRIQAIGMGTHVGAQMTHSTAEYARIGNFAAHFEINDAG